MQDPVSDKLTKPIELERKKVWKHGKFGLGKLCGRNDRPIYTNPDKVPDACRNDNCGNREWISDGSIIRIKDTKQIVHQE